MSQNRDRFPQPHPEPKRPPTTMAAGQPDHPAPGEVRPLLHDLQNSLASLKLRLSLLASDPVCRRAQEENVTALLRIVQEAIDQTHQIGRAVHR